MAVKGHSYEAVYYRNNVLIVPIVSYLNLKGFD
jgi:hypothetical protein